MGVSIKQIKFRDVPDVMDISAQVWHNITLYSRLPWIQRLYHSKEKVLGDLNEGKIFGPIKYVCPSFWNML